MAEQTDTPAESPKRSKKTLILIAALLLLEAGGVFMVMKMMGGPEKVEASDALIDIETDENRPVEILVLQDRLPNQSTGRIWLYDTEIYVQVRSSDKEAVEKIFEERGAEVKTGIREIWGRATAEDFKEPRLEKLTTQTREYLNRIIGDGPDGTPLIQKVLIPKCNGFRADF